MEGRALLLLRLAQQLAGAGEVLRPKLLRFPVRGLLGPRDARPARLVAVLGVLFEPLLPLVRLLGLRQTQARRNSFIIIVGNVFSGSESKSYSHYIWENEEA